MSKALLIQSYTTLTTGVQGDWNALNMANSYIQGIQTGDILSSVNAQTLNALISGVPHLGQELSYLNMPLIQLIIPIRISTMADC